MDILPIDNFWAYIFCLYIVTYQIFDNLHFLSTEVGFKYEDFFKSQILKKKMDHSYRVFKKVNRNAEQFPSAVEYSWGKRPIQVWCSNDYLGMSAHPEVKNAVM